MLSAAIPPCDTPFAEYLTALAVTFNTVVHLGWLLLKRSDGQVSAINASGISASGGVWPKSGCRCQRGRYQDRWGLSSKPTDEYRADPDSRSRLRPDRSRGELAGAARRRPPRRLHHRKRLRR